MAQTESRKALHELIDLLQEVDRRWVSEEWNLSSEEDIVDAHRALMHMLEGGLVTMFENDPAHPQFRRIVTPTRKLSGDNSDAVYFDAPVSAGREYLVRGNMAGAVYVSITIEEGNAHGGMSDRTGGVLNQSGFDVDEQGFFEIRLGGAAADRNWLALGADASRITTRHYFEHTRYAAADPACVPQLSIEPVHSEPVQRPDDAVVAAGIRRVERFVRDRTLSAPPMASMKQPPFVSIEPNRFPKPVPPGDFGLAAFDAHYSMAPYFLGPDEALVVTGRWPECLFGNVNLWTRFQQTYDYANRQVSLNRKQTRLEEDGSFRMVIAHRDPGVANWLDTEGRPLGMVFWRYFMVTGEVETPQAKLVPFADLASA